MDNNKFKELNDLLEKLRLLNSKLDKLTENLSSKKRKADTENKEEAKILPFKKKDTETNEK
jgi:hypothetical protein